MIEEEGIPPNEPPDEPRAMTRQTEGRYVVSSDDTVGMRTMDKFKNQQHWFAMLLIFDAEEGEQLVLDPVSRYLKAQPRK